MLFADVKGSMDLAARMDPEEWGDLMERFFAILRDGVNRFDGRIDKFTGDGIMALFGAPIAFEDHAQRACEAALHLRDELARYSRELERERNISFAVRMGLNSGEVVAGSIGEDLRVEYTAVGNTVGLAQRMESLAVPGTVYLAAATATLVEGYFELRDLGPMQAKGVAEAVAVFELVGRGALRTPLEVAAARGFSRFVGREREMAALEGALARASQGTGQVLSVVAEPGVGKSRLCHEFAERVRARGVDVFTAHGLAHARSVSFVPVLEILRAQFGITEQDDGALARAKIARTARELDAAIDDALPLLFDFLGVPDPESPAPAIDPEAGQRQIFGALTRLRRARSARGPFVIVVEDLHWLDPGSAAFLENLIGDVPGTRLLLVTTCRPEYRAPWADRSDAGHLPLLPLEKEASEELLRDLLGPHPSLDGLAERVRERTGGNPFFIQEVVQGLVEEGGIVGRRGAYQLAKTIGEVSIPATVHTVLAARIDRLSKRDKVLLQTAAVMGRRFSGRLVGRVSGLDGRELESALRTLVEAEFIYEAAAYPEEEYTFKHALTEEVAYRSQLTKRRARVHAAVARALAELDADRLDERASLIAHHFELGAELLDAARWNARAAAWAGSSHPVEAARHWRRVRTLTDRLESSSETTELGINARLQLLNFLARLGAASEEGAVPFEEEAATVFAEAEAFAQATDQMAVKASLLSAYGRIRGHSEAAQEGYQLGLRATKIADETGEPGLRAAARIPLAWNLFMLGRVREAAAVAEEGVRIVGDDRSVGRGMILTSLYAWWRMQVAHFTAYFDRLDDGLAGLERAIELTGEEGDGEVQAWACRNWAVIADLAGADPDAAAAHVLQGLNWVEEAGGPWSRIFVRQGFAISLAQRGQWREAIDTVDETLAIARNRRIGLPLTSLLLTTRARAQLGLGDVLGARANAEEAVALAVKYGTQADEARARHQLARAILADLAPGKERAARAELDHALSIVETLGIRAFAPQVHLERAHVALAVGDEAGYHAELRTAQRRFLDVGAPARAKEVVPWSSPADSIGPTHMTADPPGR